ncbi:MAG: hemerythrin domain-containing protein [Burkholderiales bacterium]|nr:hemerythrin domain-containing protein [Burkholderiales bacterium]
MPDTLALWHAEHANFARLLDLLDDQLALFCGGATPDYELMLNIMFYMTRYSDVLHHPKEDLVFAKIKEREHATARTVDELTRQHALLKRSGADLVRHLDDILNGTVSSRAVVEAIAGDYLDTLRNHMRIEESEILPLAARLLTREDWTAIHRSIGHVDDPLFGKHPEPRYVELVEQITRQAQATHPDH